MVVGAGASPSAWWRDAVVYQIYPKSFSDADGDGIGDLRGIVGRLPHLAWLGVDALWISPFYVSPQADGGYDVADYCAVDPMFGTLADFDELVARAHELGLRVIVDVVPNHTSSAHPWFREAVEAPAGSPARRLYHLRSGRGPGGAEPPNDWRSIFGGSAWTPLPTAAGTADDVRTWYLHTFDASQPDLNWDEPAVRSRLEEVLRFWLDRGVDGFRVDVAHGLVKAAGLPDSGGQTTAAPMGVRPDEVVASGPRPASGMGPMFDQDGVHEVYRSWRRLLDSYPGQRILVGEAVVEPVARAALYVRPDEMHQAFNFPFMHAPWRATELRRVIEESLAAEGAVGAASTWALSNHDVVRHTTRLGYPSPGRSPNGIGPDDPQPDAELGLRRARAALLLMLGLPGSVYLYQGEELGLPEHTMLAEEARQDPIHVRSGGAELGRDGCRVPLPWAAAAPALGFSTTGARWLPQPAAWADLALDRQQQDPASTLVLHRTAIALRRRLALGSGRLRWAHTGHDPDAVLAFHNGSTLVLVNFTDAEVALPAGSEVVLRSDTGSATPATGRRLPPHAAAWLR